MQANNIKARRVHAEETEALLKPEEVKQKMPKNPNHKVGRLDFTAHLKLGNWICGYMAKGCQLCQPKAKTQPRPRASVPA
ncbi:hypothetical protein LEMLEM_LOCUS15275 [Lemmus lemmus]